MYEYKYTLNTHTYSYFYVCDCDVFNEKSCRSCGRSATKCLNSQGSIKHSGELVGSWWGIILAEQIT